MWSSTRFGYKIFPLYLAYGGRRARNRIYTGFLHFNGIAEEVMDGFRCNFMRRRLLENACVDLHEMLRVDRCRNIDELSNFLARFGL